MCLFLYGRECCCLQVGNCPGCRGTALSMISADGIRPGRLVNVKTDRVALRMLMRHHSMYPLKTLMATGFLGNATLIVGLIIQNPRKGNAADGFTFEYGFCEVDEIYVGPAGL